jgi:hypothetical protein
MKLAEAFGVTLNDLYSEPSVALVAAVAAMVDAPIEQADADKVTPIKRKTTKARK